MIKFTDKLSLLTLACLLLVACRDKPTGDLLTVIQKKGEIVVSTDPNYDPSHSSMKKECLMVSTLMWLKRLPSA